MQHHVYEVPRTNRSPETALPELCSEGTDYKNKEPESWSYQKGATEVKGAATNICLGTTMGNRCLRIGQGHSLRSRFEA